MPGTSRARRPRTRTRGRSSRVPTPRSTGTNSRDDADWVSIDHRRGSPFAPGDLNAYDPRLVGSHAGPHYLHRDRASAERPRSGRHPYVAMATSQEGFDAEWRMVQLLTIDGDLITRAELFDEDRPRRRAREIRRTQSSGARLENAASRVDERFWTYFAARDWVAMAEMLADDISTDDRRRVVNAGVRHGRDAEIANMRASPTLGSRAATSAVIATRGERLVLSSDQLLRPRPATRRVPRRVSRHRRDRRRRPDRGARLVRPRRHRRRLRGTRRPVPRRRSAPHAHTWSVISGDLRRTQPARDCPRRHRTG